MMTNVHERAVRLISVEQVEGLTTEERRWLYAHLSVCPACSNKADALRHALWSLRTVSVRLDPALVETTRLRVRRRAAAMKERRIRLHVVLIVSVLSIVWMAFTGPVLWQGFEWVGRSLGWADGIWQGAFVMIWFLPATAVALGLPLLRRGSPDLIEN